MPEFRKQTALSSRRLREILTHEGFYEISCLLVVALSASDVAALRIRHMAWFWQRFVHPLRDIDPTMRAFDPWIRDKCQILLLGPDSRLLSEQILDPDAYYTKRGRDPARLELWVIAISPNSRKHAMRASRLLRIYKGRKPLVERKRAICEFLDIVDQEYIFRQYPHDEVWPLDENGNHFRLNHRCGESVDVKVFNLALSSMSSLSHNEFVVRLDFADLEFVLPWDIRGANSMRHWKATDGFPCIYAANPFYVESGTSIYSVERIVGGTLAFFPCSPKCY